MRIEAIEPTSSGTRKGRFAAFACVAACSALLGATGVAFVDASRWRDEAANARSVLDQGIAEDAQRSTAVTVLMMHWRADVERFKREAKRTNSNSAKHAENALREMLKQLR